MPPEYVESETGGAVGRTVDYFNDDRETLDLYADVGPPLDNVKPVIFRYIDQRIDGAGRGGPRAVGVYAPKSGRSGRFI